MLTIIAKRLFSILAVCATGSWSLFVVIVDAFDHANSAKAALLGAGMPEWLFPPWWGPITSLVVLTGFVIWLNWPTPAPTTGAQGPANEAPAQLGSSVSPKASRIRHLIDGDVTPTDQSVGVTHILRFKVKKRTSALSVYIELNVNRLEKLKIASFSNLTSGELLKVPVFSYSDPVGDRGHWCWFGSLENDGTDVAHPRVVGSAEPFRIVISYDDGFEEDLYAKLEWNNRYSQSNHQRHISIYTEKIFSFAPVWDFKLST